MSYAEMIKNKKDNECVVDLLYKIFSDCKCQDCGKCVFGYEGVFQLTTILKDFTEKKARGGDMDLIKELAGYLRTQTISECDEGVALADALDAAFANYGDEMMEHANKKACRAGVCKKYMTYHILPDKCNACGDCMDACEEDAILGKPRFIHVISLTDCTLCGKCMEVCEEGAIVMAGAEKPRGPKQPIPCRKK